MIDGITGKMLHSRTLNRLVPMNTVHSDASGNIYVLLKRSAFSITEEKLSNIEINSIQHMHICTSRFCVVTL